jgi:hypothetical protein
MPIGKQIGIGPAVRVFRHFIERRRFYQLKFASGEQALVLVAGMPAPSVELVRLTLGGLLPWQTVWEYNPIRAGGYSDYLHKLKAMFSPSREGSDDSVHHIRDVLLSCRSIDDARTLLLQRERLANSPANETAGDFTRSRPPRSGTTNEGWELGIRHHGSSGAAPKPNGISESDDQRGNGKSESFYAANLAASALPTVPTRYHVRQDGKTRVLTCVEAPPVTIRAERGLTISAKQTRRFPPGTIFLDGVAQGDPFIDVQQELYNLHHPEGCVRSLATCEQAMVLIRKGLDLRKRDWVIWTNDADLDTVLALWVLLNHNRLNDRSSKVRAKIMPLLRLAGVIDAHGREVQDLAGLPPDLLRSTSAMLKQLQQQESVLKDYGRWTETDLPEYIADRLRAVDELIYAPEDFDGFHEVDELARAQITDGSVAVVCASDASMDEVERQLQRTYGQRLGILILQLAASTYKVRQIDKSLPTMLGQAYERLNLLDPAATSGPENRWGGSAELGFSPRKTGTGLSPAQIIEAVRETFSKPRLFDIVAEFPRAALLAGGALLPALAMIVIGNLLRDRGYITGASAPLAAVVLAITVVILFCAKARLVPGLYGWRIPTGSGWLRTLPAALIGGAIGGAWGSDSLAFRTGPDNLYPFTGIAALLFSLAAELLFRGVILGNLAARLPIQKSGGPWWRSWPTLISTALYAVASLLLFLTVARGESQISQYFLVVVGAVIFGISSGVARERSESVLPCIALHWGCAALLLLVSRLLA